MSCALWFTDHWANIIIGTIRDEVFRSFSLLSLRFLFECRWYPPLIICHNLGNRIDSKIFKGTRNALLWFNGIMAASSLNKSGQAFCDEYCIKVTIRQIPLFWFYSIATFRLLEIAVECCCFVKHIPPGLTLKCNVISSIEHFRPAAKSS